MIIELLVAGFLVAHGLIHALYLTPPPPPAETGGPAWPFVLERSWLLSPVGLGPGVTRTIGTALIGVTVGGFGLAAIAGLGVLTATLWVPAVVIGTVASLVLLGLFFRPWLVLGVGIDVALLYAVVVGDWVP